MIRLIIRTAFFYFILVALLGIILRAQSIFHFNLPYANLLHTHSHIAFLGWVYTACFAFYYYLLQSNCILNNDKNFKAQFYITQIATIGMLISFPLQGYGLFSISFSTLHIFCSFWFAFTFLRSLRKLVISTLVKFFSVAAIFFMMLSAIGPLSLGVIIKLYGHSSTWYFNTIYYYLHFQYNGWFIFSVFAFLFYYLDVNSISYNQKNAFRFFIVLFITCIPCYVLSVLWSNPGTVFYIIGIVFALLQLFSLYFLLITFRTSEIKTHLFKNNPLKFLLQCVLICFSLKLILQFLSAFPYFAQLAYEQKGFIIGYLHLCLLGVISPLLIYFTYAFGFFNKQMPIKKIMIIYLIGFVLTELILFLHSSCTAFYKWSIPFFTEFLLVGSLFLLISSLSVFFVLKRN